ncbi:MFS transporter [Amycolatopsis sp. NPDC004772]
MVLPGARRLARGQLHGTGWSVALPRTGFPQGGPAGVQLRRSVVAGCLFISGNFHLAAIVALEFANGTLTAFTSPALRGIVPQLVDADHRQRANSLLGSSKNLTSIVGPSLAGGIVLAFGGGWAIDIDAVSCLSRRSAWPRCACRSGAQRGNRTSLQRLRSGRRPRRGMHPAGRPHSAPHWSHPMIKAHRRNPLDQGYPQVGFDSVGCAIRDSNPEPAG